MCKEEGAKKYMKTTWKRSTWKLKNYIKAFSGKIIVCSKWVPSHNSEFTLRVVFMFCTRKGAKRYMKIILFFFQKKFCRGKWVILGPKVMHPCNSGSALTIFLKFAIIWFCSCVMRPFSLSFFLWTFCFCYFYTFSLLLSSTRLWKTNTSFL